MCGCGGRTEFVELCANDNDCSRESYQNSAGEYRWKTSNFHFELLDYNLPSFLFTQDLKSNLIYTFIYYMIIIPIL